MGNRARMRCVIDVEGFEWEEFCTRSIDRSNDSSRTCGTRRAREWTVNAVTECDRDVCDAGRERVRGARA